jgi:hypothetical protein
MSQLIEMVDTLKEKKMLDSLKLMHYHLGSQIPNIRDIRSAVLEAARVYAELVKEGAPLGYLDLGGGLALPKIVIAFVASWLIGFLSMLTPGGLGVREVVLMLLLTPQLTPAQASTVALISRLTWTVVEMGGVLIGMAIGKRHFAEEAEPAVQAQPASERG